MTPRPARPKIYHITHVDNLPAIVADGGLVSDATMIARGGPARPIGMSSIKRRRIEELEVDCHPGTKVGDYVPFYLCPRPVMLYVIHCANHPELSYRGGQGPIVHLEADLYTAVAWAESEGRRWAFTLSNAGARYFEARADLAQLHEINWDAVAANRWSGPGIAESVREGKQAEFLVERSFPWSLVERIGVHSHEIAQRVASAVQGAAHRPGREVRTDWYY